MRITLGMLWTDYLCVSPLPPSNSYVEVFYFYVAVLTPKVAIFVDRVSKEVIKVK